MPSESTLPDPSKLTFCPTIELLGETAKLATGGVSAGGKTWTYIPRTCVRLPEWPKTGTKYIPAEVVLVVAKSRTDVTVPPELRTTLVGFRIAVGSLTGVVRVIVPANPLIDERVMVRVALLPAVMAPRVELVDIWKVGGGGGITVTTVTWKETE